MAYTKHGHLIPNTSPASPAPKPIKYCGGTVVCAECLAESIDYLKTPRVELETTHIFDKEKVTEVETKTYQRKPFEVEAIQVTEENFEQIAAWCGGSIVTVQESQDDVLMAPEKRHISVDVARPLSRRQTEAYVGDWILYASKGFKVYADRPFRKNFEEKLEELFVTSVPAR